MTIGQGVRVGAVLLGAALAAASATSSSTPPPTAPASGAPQAQPMDLQLALGLWKSNFGAVKIEEDFSRGGPQAGFLHGVWTYQRGGADVVGVFAGTIRGNVFEFTWQEPGEPAPLHGAGFVAFDLSGQSYRGQWWTDNRDRSGEWTGWRQAAAAQPGPADGAVGDATYGGAVYGAAW